MNKQKIVGYWLILGVIMVLIQIMLGGITRLTGSGLSITEWNVIKGALPPSTDQHWSVLFDKYKQFDQYKLVNTQMTITEFKSIYFWEWFHRNWARFLSIVFAIPLLFFVVKKYITKQQLPKILFIMLLGALEGVMGIIMVFSGLKDAKVLVNPIKLMGHLLIASIIIVYTYQLALQFLYPKNNVKYDVQNYKKLNWLVVFLFIQIAFGALVAGSKAALNCTQWPMMCSGFIPQNFGIHTPFIENTHYNNLTIQFLHRCIAYFITFYIVFIFIKTKMVLAKNQFYFARLLMLILVFVQVFLGILTLINSKGNVPLHLGVIHQLTAFLLLLTVIRMRYFLKYHAISTTSIR